MNKGPVVAVPTADGEKQPPEPASIAQETVTASDTDPLSRLFEIKPGQGDSDTIRDLVAEQVRLHLQQAGVETNYNVVFLYAPRIVQVYANRIYSALKPCDRAKPLLLFVNSPGGDVASAYMIAKVCREHTRATFEVAVPRQAKSAATLISCGADKLHLGSLSELGPIDPQLNGIPALACKHSIEHIAQLATQYPGASSMFSEYLSRTLPVQALGYYERVARSASQYAIRLLTSRKLPNDPKRNTEIAERLVYHYKDHGFVIDTTEATEIFGADAVSTNTQEYALASDLLESFDLMAWCCQTRLGFTLSLVGGPDGCLALRDASNSD